MSLEIDLCSPAFQRDPYPDYAALRQEDPVHRASRFERPTWLLTRYSDVCEVLRDPRCSAEDVPLEGERARRVAPDAPLLARLLPQILLMKDGREHARLRGLVADAFRPQAVARRAPRVDALVEELLRPLHRDGEFDLMHDFAGILPVVMIAEILGLPTEDAPQLRRWSLDMAPVLDPTLRSSELARVGAAAGELCDYLERIFRRGSSAGGLVSRLSGTAEAQLGASRVEALAAIFFLLAAGNETIASAIGNAVVALLDHPDQLELLRSQPRLRAGAVEELLRYDCPVQASARRPRHDLVIGGRRIRRGEDLFLLFGAANRDPEQFPEPDRLDLVRPNASRHLAFSAGPHYCLGAALGRLECRAALGAVLARFPVIRAVLGRVRRRRGFVFRGFDELRLRVELGGPSASPERAPSAHRRNDDADSAPRVARARAVPGGAGAPPR